MTRAILAALSLALVGCPARHPPGWQGIDNAAPCDAACRHLDDMHCPSSTPKGTPCLEVCRHGNDVGYMPMPTTCLASAPDCAAAEECR